jgi:acyl-CoA thioester hydrolase
MSTWKTVTCSVRVIYGDTDQMGVVYYGNYLRFFEAARAEWLRAQGRTNKDIEQTGVFLPVTEAHVKYRGPARYEDLLHVEVTPDEVRSASLKFRYTVRRDGDPQVLCDGWTTHACINREGRPRRFPEELAEIMRRAQLQ